MHNLMGKRLVMGVASILCVTIATCFLKYDGEIYLKLVGIIVTAFMAAQTVTDSIGK